MFHEEHPCIPDHKNLQRDTTSLNVADPCPILSPNMWRMEVTIVITKLILLQKIWGSLKVEKIMHPQAPGMNRWTLLLLRTRKNLGGANWKVFLLVNKFYFNNRNKFVNLLLRLVCMLTLLYLLRWLVLWGYLTGRRACVIALLMRFRSRCEEVGREVWQWPKWNWYVNLTMSCFLIYVYLGHQIFW